jgi:hypothetical protein
MEDKWDILGDFIISPEKIEQYELAKTTNYPFWNYQVLYVRIGLVFRHPVFSCLSYPVHP